MAEIILYEGSGASGFRREGPPLDPLVSKRMLLNARQILNIRGQMAAIEVLDSAPFELVPATNHFGDEFVVLSAVLPLVNYEQFRLSAATLRAAARELGEVFREVDGPYVRFIAIELKLAEPDEWDVFICHATEDKDNVARPLSQYLKSVGVRCWIDEAEIAWGDSIVAKVQQGICCARFVIVVLSSSLLGKGWAMKELQSALTLEIDSKKNVVLPLVAGDPEKLLASLPFLKDKLYVKWDGDPGAIAEKLRTLLNRVES